MFSFLFILATASSGRAATTTGTTISNIASASYNPDNGGSVVTVSSTAASVLSTALTPSAVIEFLTYAPTLSSAESVTVRPTSYSSSGTTGPFTQEPAPTMTGSTTPLNLNSPLPLTPATVFHAGEPVFIRLTALYLNNDPTVAETAIVTITNDGTGDSEVLQLTETGPNTGVFTGYVPTDSLAATRGNGILDASANSKLSANYSDTNYSLATTTTAMVDPYGIVFNSATGSPVNGAKVMLMDVATGAQAVVYGDDGVSTYPASVTSGGSAQDSSGKTYTFSSGGYRYPYIKPGTYQLYVIPPIGYKAPSTVSDTTLQALAGAPFSIVSPGSRAENFVVNPGPAIHIDIPVDPTGTSLYLVKTVDKDQAAAGDFLPYHLTVENLDSSNTASAVVITDRLPHALRYRKGSAKLNGVRTADPAVSSDGRSLSFSIGDLAASATAEVRYVAEVGAGTPLGNAVNTAIAASSSGAKSNTASATVKIYEDLFQSKATIVGRVLDGCGPDAKGVPGIRIYMEDGTYVVTDKQGMYHFSTVNPGTHVVQLDAATSGDRYQPLLCEDSTRFAGTGLSQFVDLQGGTLWRADFHVGPREKEPEPVKEKTIGVAGLELRSSLMTDPASGATPTLASSPEVGYAVPMQVRGVPVRGLRLVVMLPDGVTYKNNSSRLNGAPVPDPVVTEGVLTYRLGDQAADWDGTVRFDASVPAEGAPGDLSTRAFLVFNTPEAKGVKTPMAENTLTRTVLSKTWTAPAVVLRPRFASLKAELSREDRLAIEKAAADLKELQVHHITVTGHTDSNAIRKGASREFPDNYILSQARARAVADVIRRALNLSDDQITIVGKGPDDPVESNKSEKGRAMNRRVELNVEVSHASGWSEVQTTKDASGVKTVATTGLPAGDVWQPEGGAAVVKVAEKPEGDGKSMPEYSASWLATADPGTEWLWPAEGYHPRIASITIAVKHALAQKPKLFLNNDEVEPVFFDHRVKKADDSLAVSVWSGIHLREGDNTFALALYDGDNEVKRLVRTIHYSGDAVNAVLVPEKSRLIADGKNPIVLAIRLTDKEGHPGRESSRGEYFIDAPFEPQQLSDELQAQPLTAPDTKLHNYVVGDDGIALIELRPTGQTGEAVLHLTLAGGSREIRAWVKPEQRDWVLVGLAEGTVGYNVVTGNMESSLASGVDDKLYEDDRVAFFAKGSIKGEWLLTLAYDSAKKAVDNGGLYQTIDPSKYYTLYGDATDQRYDAASAKHIYVKLEREQFYALFGDTNAGLTLTELSRYNRNFTGFKSEMKSDRFDYAVFGSQTDQSYARDEIQGDGTSGLYHLSHKNIVMNSDTITVETRDRYRSEVIVSSQQMTRFIDYDIDYTAGTLFFKSPVYSKDENFNPIYIVAEYEAQDPSGNVTFGGRGAARFLDKKVEVGATYVHQGDAGDSGNLAGVDAKIKLSETTTLKTEAATAKSDVTGTTASGSAYLVEVQHRTETLEGRAYAREEQAGFGLGQQNASEADTRKAGADFNYHLTKPWTMGGEVYRMDTVSTGASQELEELRTKYTLKQYDVDGGLRHAEDRASDGTVTQSDQVFTGMAWRVDERLTLRAKHDQSIGDNSAAEYPTRTTLGADYRLTEKTLLFGEQEWTSGSSGDTETSRIGIKASPWTGGQVGSTVEQQVSENGVRLFSTNGLKQTWQVNRHWSLDAGLDRTQTLRTSETVSTSTEDFTAVSLGAGYREEKWSWTGRVENRVSDSEHKTGVYSGANGEVRKGLALAGSLSAYWTHDSNGAATTNSDLRLSLAYRPFSTQYIILDRLDFLEDDQTGPDTSAIHSRRIVNNFVTNIQANERMQVSLQYGAKYVFETIDSDDYSGYTDLMGIEGRYDLSKRWDIGLRGLRLCSWSLKQEQYGVGVSTGFNAGKNIWISVGYNVEGFKDRDFSASDFTSAGPFIKMRLKFDQASVRDAVKWFSSTR